MEFTNDQSNHKKLHDQIKTLRVELKSKEQIIKNLRNIENVFNPSTELSNKNIIRTDSVNQKIEKVEKNNTNYDFGKQNKVGDNLSTNVFRVP